MTSGGRRRPAKPSSSVEPHAPNYVESAQRAAAKARERPRRTLHKMKSFIRTPLGLLLAMLLLVASGIYFYRRARPGEGSELKRVVTPLDAPKMMDLPQFQGEHKESLYWGTYRPHVYLGIRARTPKSLIAGLMWLGIKNGQYVLRHICQDSDDLKTYGWVEHNGRNYGRHAIVDNELTLTTSFIKSKGIGSGYGGDWAVRINVENEKSNIDEPALQTVHTFFYVADEEGNALNLDKAKFQFDKSTVLTSGSRKDVGSWEIYMTSVNDADIHYSGFRTPHMHNLTELLQAVLAVNARKTGLIQLPDTAEDAANVIFFQVSVKYPSQVDITFLSGTGVKGSNVEERIYNLTGTLLSSQLMLKERQHHEDLMTHFNLSDKVDSDSAMVGKAAIGNLLGGVGYFYGQSKIALPKELSMQNGDKFLFYWPAALFTAVPSRPFFPRGFLWDEGFHQLLVWQWDIDICLDIIGHWLDLMNVDGWIPREQILGAEALSKVPEEFVLQHPTNGNPPTLFLVLRDIASKMQENTFSETDRIKITSFLERAYVRLEAWFHWYNNTQSGKELYTYYWHGRDSTTTRELNPKSLMSGLDDYPRASHPSEDERHLDLRCWMLLAADSLHSIGALLGRKDSFGKRYEVMARHLSDFEILNQMHLDNTYGAYFDFGNHTEKVRLRWFEVRNTEVVRRELAREVMESPRPSLVPHFGYVSLFPFIMGIIPHDSWIFERHLQLISNRSTLWTPYGLRSLAKTSSLYMKWNTEHDGPYWRGQIWINMNYLILSALNRYSQYEGPYQNHTKGIYNDLRQNLISNVVHNYHESGYLWEQYDPKGKGKKAHPFTGWTALILLIMSESYPKL